ncbi:MAG: Na+/H+ antiporter NhaA, partial [Vulcanimicrobiota bacterium]
MSRRRPIDIVLRPLSRFIHGETTAGLVLGLAAVVAMIWANSQYADSYHALWHTHLSLSVAGQSLDKTLHHWISDGLMAMFFFVVGLEIKREVMAGRLSNRRDALLPVVAAV